jgi:hypothetical protein
VFRTCDLSRVKHGVRGGVGPDLVGTDVVEVIPSAVGSADASALVAERTVREALTGLALRRRHGA